MFKYGYNNDESFKWTDKSKEILSTPAFVKYASKSARKIVRLTESRLVFGSSRPVVQRGHQH